MTTKQVIQGWYDSVTTHLKMNGFTQSVQMATYSIWSGKGERFEIAYPKAHLNTCLDGLVRCVNRLREMLTVGSDPMTINGNPVIWAVLSGIRWFGSFQILAAVDSLPHEGERLSLLQSVHTYGFFEKEEGLQGEWCAAPGYADAYLVLYFIKGIGQDGKPRKK